MALNIEMISDFLGSKRLGLISYIRIRPSDDTILIYVDAGTLTDTVEKGKVTERQLTRIKNKVTEEYAKSCEIIFLQNEEQNKLELSLFTLLNRKFDDEIISFFISIKSGNVIDSWIEVDDLDEEKQVEVQEHFKQLLTDIDLTIGDINWLDSPADLPSDMALLRKIKINQPIDINNLSIELSEYSSVTEKWINRNLDRLRKKGFIKRQHSGGYVLSHKGIATVPAGKNYHSSDIDRVLALGKRKW